MKPNQSKIIVTVLAASVLTFFAIEAFSLKGEGLATAGIPSFSSEEIFALAQSVKKGDDAARKQLSLFYFYAPLTNVRLKQQSVVVATTDDASLLYQLNQDIAAKFACQTPRLLATHTNAASRLKYDAEAVTNDLDELKSLPVCTSAQSYEIDQLLERSE